MLKNTRKIHRVLWKHDKKEEFIMAKKVIDVETKEEIKVEETETKVSFMGKVKDGAKKIGKGLKKGLPIAGAFVAGVLFDKVTTKKKGTSNDSDLVETPVYDEVVETSEF